MKFLMQCFVLSLSLSLPVYALTEVQCLASVIYKEARGESDKGKLAVAHVVLNRAEKYGMKVCQVITKKGQFSWYSGKRSFPKKHEISSLIPLADRLLAKHHLGERKDFTKGSTHFIKRGYKNYWTKEFVRTMIVGGHTFYRQPSKYS